MEQQLYCNIVCDFCFELYFISLCLSIGVLSAFKFGLHVYDNIAFSLCPAFSLFADFFDISRMVCSKYSSFYGPHIMVCLVEH